MDVEWLLRGLSMDEEDEEEQSRPKRTLMEGRTPHGR